LDRFLWSDETAKRFSPRPIAICKFDQFSLERLVFHGAFGQELRQELAVPITGKQSLHLPDQIPFRLIMTWREGKSRAKSRMPSPRQRHQGPP
jgi:hypothetical protein